MPCPAPLADPAATLVELRLLKAEGAGLVQAQAGAAAVSAVATRPAPAPPPPRRQASSSPYPALAELARLRAEAHDMLAQMAVV
jgi:predicted nucleic acid-binding Zn ribbon protein